MILLGSTKNLILHVTLSLTLTLLLSILKIPILFLHGLHTYIHPDDVNPNNSKSAGGLRAAIRRPGTSSDYPDPPRPKKKSKDNKFEFDENKAQIFRLKLNDAHLQSRPYFTHFRATFISIIVASFSLLLQQFLSLDKDSGVLANGTLVPLLLGLVCICRVLFLVARVSFEQSASKKSEKQVSVFVGVLGFLLGLMIVFEVVPHWVLDFEFGSLDVYGRFAVAALMAFIVGFLYMPAAKNARAFWLGTDQIRSNLSIIPCGWIGRMLLYANYLLLIFSSVVWITPFAELLVNKNMNGSKASNVIDAEELVGNVGMLRSDFDRSRIWCLLVLGILQMATLRPNLQIYLNEAVLSWYQRLHASKVPDLDFSRAKVFLHNHHLCLVALQFLAPSALVLLFLGLSQVDDNMVENFQVVCSLLPCSALVKEVALFLAWWVVFVWAFFTSASLALYRRGILYVS
ncbi:hypothetical protein LguiA_024046 [Lonicera macranthoides]